MKSVVNLHKLKHSLTKTKNDWVRVDRPAEKVTKLAFVGDRARTFGYALGFAAAMFLLVGFFAYAQPKQTPVQAVTTVKAQKEASMSKPKPTAPPAHIVRPNENLWAIASDYYGDGRSWKKMIVKKKTDTLRPGDVVEFPQE